jgi:hypothetical protein
MLDCRGGNWVACPISLGGSREGLLDEETLSVSTFRTVGENEALLGLVTLSGGTGLISSSPSSSSRSFTAGEEP